MRGGMTGESGGPENTAAGGGGGGNEGPSSGSALSGVEVAKILHRAGFRGVALKRAIAVAWKESRFNPRTTNFSSRERSYGLMQINMNDNAIPGLNGPGMGKKRLKTFNIGSYEDLFNPDTNARVAYELWSGNTSGEGKKPAAHWRPWGGPEALSKDSLNRASTYIKEARLPEGDPAVSMRGPAVSSGGGGALYNISVAPVINISSSGNTTVDSQKVAREVSDMLEREVRLTMMRTS
jgi:hypothetical protein